MIERAVEPAYREQLLDLAQSIPGLKIRQILTSTASYIEDLEKRVLILNALYSNPQAIDNQLEALHLRITALEGEMRSKASKLDIEMLMIDSGR